MRCQEGNSSNVWLQELLQFATVEHNWLNRNVYIKWNKEASHLFLNIFFNVLTRQYPTSEKNNGTADVDHDDA